MAGPGDQNPQTHHLSQSSQQHQYDPTPIIIIHAPLPSPSPRLRTLHDQDSLPDISTTTTAGVTSVATLYRQAGSVNTLRGHDTSRNGLAPLAPEFPGVQDACSHKQLPLQTTANGVPTQYHTTSHNEHPSPSGHQAQSGPPRQKCSLAQTEQKIPHLTPNENKEPVDHPLDTQQSPKGPTSELVLPGNQAPTPTTINMPAAANQPLHWIPAMKIFLKHILANGEDNQSALILLETEYPQLVGNVGPAWVEKVRQKEL